MRRIALSFCVLLGTPMTLSAADLNGARTAHTAADVDGVRIAAAARDPASWMTTGRTYGEERFSPLAQINDGNVGRLGLAWHFDFESTIGLEATPLVVDGVMYTTGVWNILHAIDAKTGKDAIHAYLIDRAPESFDKR